MSYNFSKSEVLSVEANSLMDPPDRVPFDSFIASYGKLGPEPCPFCSEKPRRFYYAYIWTHGAKADSKEEAWQDTHLLVCPRCVWFRIESTFFTENADAYATHHYSSYQRRTSDLSSLPLERLEAHLARKWEDWKEMTAGQAEDLIAGIFSEHLDAKIHYTTNGVFSPDGGIDFVLVETKTGLEYAFQVKRRLTDKPERVRPIREFIGSLALKGYKKGYFVTFAPRVTKTAEKEIKEGTSELAMLGKSINVVDGTRLYDILRNSRDAHLQDHRLLAPFPSLPLPAKQEWHEIPLEQDTLIVPKSMLSASSLSITDILKAI